jgi:hypothetical protein
MTDEHRLEQQDVALRLAPPAPGSDRYQRILERAMTSTINATTITPPPARKTRWVRWGAAAVGAAAVVVVAGTFVLGGSPQPASAAWLAAAQHTEEVKSLRIAVTNPGSGGQFAAKIDVNGADSRSVYTSNETKNPTVTTVVGGEIYETDSQGRTSHAMRDPAPVVAPFARAAGHVVAAAAGDGTVEELGQDKVDGVETRHFRTTLKERTSAAQPEPALAKLPKSELTWFDLEDVDAYSSGVLIDIWVSDDHLIRRLSVDVPQQEGNTTVMDFSDFNAPIEITAPK